MSAREQATGKWRGVLVALGIPNGILDGKHHACPNGQGVDRFRFADRNGSGNYFCACSDGKKGGMALVMCCKQLDYATAAREVEKVVGRTAKEEKADRPDPRIALNKLQKMLKPAGYAVNVYLRARGLEIAPALKQARLAYWQDSARIGVFDAMVARVTGPTGKPESFHVTYLDGAKKADVKCPRKVMTPVNTITGGAIQLYPPGQTLGIAEGIETAIAAHLMSGLPVWAAVSAHGIETFEPPSTTTQLVIFGDADASFTGQAAAYELARRMAKRSLPCEVRLPDAGDWNDVLKRKAA